MDTDDHTLFVDGNNITVTLPDPDSGVDDCAGRIYYIKNTSDATASGDNATNYGVRSNANGENSNYGVYSTASGLAATNYAVYSNATGSSATNYGIYATASGGTTNWAGYFQGTAKITDALTLTPHGSLPAVGGYEEGTIIVAFYSSANHIFCKLNGSWVQLD